MTLSESHHRSAPSAGAGEDSRTVTPPGTGPTRSPSSAVAPRKRRSRQWLIFIALTLITLVTLVPVIAVIGLSLRPAAQSTSTAVLTFENFSAVFHNTDIVTWLTNSLLVTLATVAVSVVVAAPAGYALSRGRGKAVSGYSLLLFVVQSLPVITALIPLFILFAHIGLTDSLLGLLLVYVGHSISVATWMMAAYMDSIPATLEEAAWVDGVGVWGSFTRIVLRNSLPGILSTACFSFLVAWNDYLVALVFLRSSDRFTLPVGIETFFQQNSTEWGAVMAVSVVMLLPPVILFMLLNKYFSVGGIGGSLAGT